MMNSGYPSRRIKTISGYRHSPTLQAPSLQRNFAMLGYIICLVVGAFIGWLIPMPNWAKRTVAWAKTKFGSNFNK